MSEMHVYLNKIGLLTYACHYVQHLVLIESILEVTISFNFAWTLFDLTFFVWALIYMIKGIRPV